jgi:predicted lipoprotein with Yx(FWY)xxD motif
MLPGVLAVMVAAGSAVAASGSMRSQAGTVETAKTKLGTVLVASNGRTLYRFTVDSKDINRCSGNATCNKYWPALLMKAGTKPTAGPGAKAALLGTIKAPHGKVQVTYAGYPLYFFAGDKSAGQAGGQGFDSKWYVVNTNGGLIK